MSDKHSAAALSDSTLLHIHGHAHIAPTPPQFQSNLPLYPSNLTLLVVVTSVWHLLQAHIWYSSTFQFLRVNSRWFCTLAAASFNYSAIRSAQSRAVKCISLKSERKSCFFSCVIDKCVNQAKQCMIQAPELEHVILPPDFHTRRSEDLEENLRLNYSNGLLL